MRTFNNLFLVLFLVLCLAWWLEVGWVEVWRLMAGRFTGRCCGWWWLEVGWGAAEPSDFSLLSGVLQSLQTFWER